MKAIIIAMHKRQKFVGAVCKGGYLSATEPAQLYDLREAGRVCDRMIDAHTEEVDWRCPVVMAVEES